MYNKKTDKCTEKMIAGEGIRLLTWTYDNTWIM